MKKTQLITLLFLGAILFCGCQKWGEPDFKLEDWVAPPDTEARQWDILSSKIIGKHTNGTPPDTIASYKEVMRYVRAVVVSSDEGGNYCKAMVIQDVTGGVELQLDMTGLYNIYPVGQKIVLICNGLVIGDYNNLPQIGWIYKGTQVGPISSLHFDKFIIKDGLPSPHNLPKPLTNLKIDFSGNTDINKLVCLERVKFEKEAIGKPIAFNDFTTEWKVTVPLENENIKDVIVRTSNYAKFRNMIIKDKEYNLTGILTINGNNYQLMIRTKDDIQVSSKVEIRNN